MDAGVACRASALFFAMVGGELISSALAREGGDALAKEMGVCVKEGWGC